MADRYNMRFFEVCVRDRVDVDAPFVALARGLADPERVRGSGLLGLRLRLRLRLGFGLRARATRVKGSFRAF